MYLTYAEYTSLGGTLSESAYTLYEFRAESIINWYTFNRLKKDTTFPDEVKKCMYMLINLLVAQDEAMGGDSASGGGGSTPSQIASQSNDGVSVSYSIMSTTELIQYRKNELDEIVQRQLQGVMNELGHRLLYRGLYPGE